MADLAVNQGSLRRCIFFTLRRLHLRPLRQQESCAFYAHMKTEALSCDSGMHPRINRLSRAVDVKSFGNLNFRFVEIFNHKDSDGSYRQVMAMAVSSSCAFALTVSADHLVGRYDLSVGVRVAVHEFAC
jgi:hypothetical protein